MNPKMSRRDLLLRPALALAGWSASATLPALAQLGAIRIVVPFTPGSGTDIIARLVGEKLAASLGTPVMIDNRPGAGGTLGAALVAKSAADGNTLLVHSSGHVVNAALYPKLPYDTLKDLDGITPLASLPNVLVVPQAAGIKDVADLVARAKARPGAMNYASAGNGSATHMNAEKFRLAAGIEAQHVPFRGTPEAITATLSGSTDWFFAPLVSALPLIHDGRLQALAVGTATRSAALPGVPSIVEAGYPGAAYTFWVALFAPAKTPRAITERLHAEVDRLLALAEVRERLDKLGAAPMTMAQPAFAQFLEDETAAAAGLVKAAGLKLD